MTDAAFSANDALVRVDDPAVRLVKLRAAVAQQETMVYNAADALERITAKRDEWPARRAELDSEYETRVVEAEDELNYQETFLRELRTELEEAGGLDR